MISKQPIISVIMPTYKRAGFIGKAIESVLSQTFEAFELIIINDGSKDNTGDICRAYMEKDNRVKFIDLQENGGAACARNKGIEASSGSYITFVDDDDVVYPEMLSFLYDLSVTYDADISICGCLYGYENSLLPKYVFNELLILGRVQGLDELLKRERFNSSNPNKLFSKKLFKNISYKENTKVDDIHFIYKLFAKSQKTVAWGKPMYVYMRHGNNNSTPLEKNTWTPALLNEYIAMQKERVVYLSKHVPQIMDRVRYAEWSFYVSMCVKIRQSNNIACNQQYDEMLSQLKLNREEFIGSKYITESELEAMSQFML